MAADAKVPVRRRSDYYFKTRSRAADTSKVDGDRAATYALATYLKREYRRIFLIEELAAYVWTWTE